MELIDIKFPTGRWSPPSRFASYCLRWRGSVAYGYRCIALMLCKGFRHPRRCALVFGIGRRGVKGAVRPAWSERSASAARAVPGPRQVNDLPSSLPSRTAAQRQMLSDFSSWPKLPVACCAATGRRRSTRDIPWHGRRGVRSRSANRVGSAAKDPGYVKIPQARICM